MSNASTIRPGLLVSLKSTVTGGVSYQRIDLDTGKPPEEGADVSRWETTRTIEDKDEYERAVKCRSAARSLITRVCSSTTFGLLCPTEQEGALDAAVQAARKLVDNHNETNPRTRVGIFVIKGEVKSNDAEAIRSITQETAELMQAIDAGIKAFDPEAIRKAANRAREMSSMLSEGAQTKVENALTQARKAARMIVARVQKEGEDRATVLLDIQRGQIESARIAFLDMSGEPDAPAEITPTVDAQRFADLDLGSEPLVNCASSVTVPTIELQEVK